MGEGFLDSGGGRAITFGGCLWCVGSCGLMGCRSSKTRDFDSGEVVDVKGDTGKICSVLWGLLVVVRSNGDWDF